MKETFPDKKRGEKLHHENDWNKISRTVQRLANQLSGSNLSSIHMGSFSGVIGHNPWQQFVATVSSTKIDDEDTDDSGLYFCKIRFYDHTETGDDKWKSREKEWLLDATDLGATLIVDDKLAVWWIPIHRDVGLRQRIWPCHPSPDREDRSGEPHSFGHHA